MPLSTDTNPVSISIAQSSVGAPHIIRANGGSVSVKSRVFLPSANSVEEDEGSVADTERMRYEGDANVLIITPSGSGVFWTVTDTKQNKVISE